MVMIIVIIVARVLARDVFLETVVQEASESSSPGEAPSVWCYRDAHGLGNQGKPHHWSPNPLCP